MNKKIRKLLLVMLMAILPALMVTIIITTQNKVPLTHFIPVSPNDQNEYWHQIATFNLAGFNGGYYTHLEQTALITQSRFGVHGPFYIVLMGLLSKISGWNYSTPIFFNMLFLALGFIIFALLSNLNNTQIILAGLTLSLFPPILIYIPTAMQESFQQMVGMLFAAIFGISLVYKEKLDFWKKVAAIAFTFFVSLIRPSWGLLFFPLLALYFPKEIKKQLLAFFISLFLLVTVIILIGSFMTPGNNTISQAIAQFSPGIRTGIKFLLVTIINNLKIYFSLANIPQMVFRLEYLLILILSFGYIVLHLRKKKKETTVKNHFNIDLNLSVLFFLIISPIILWSFALYFLKNDMRFIAPYFLLILFLLIFNKRYFFVVAFIIINLLILPASISLTTYPIGNNFTYSEEKVLATRQIMDQSIRYDPSQTNAWCNTILVPVTLYDYRISQIPAGIGISYVLNNNGIDKIIYPIKSKYLLLTLQQTIDLNKVAKDQLEPLVEFPDSILYINHKAACN
jgi:hypothetical protein